MLQHINESIKSQVGSHALGQETVTSLALAAFLAGGHILLSGPTGLGKTVWAKSFAGALGLDYGSAIITEGLMSEGFFSTMARDMQDPQQFISRPGALFSPVFYADFHLADSQPQADLSHTLMQMLNQAQMRTQFYALSHMIAAMDREHSSLTGFGPETFALPETQFIIASCNNSAALPTSLTDRFMMKIYINYPGVAAEKQLLINHHENTPAEQLVPVFTPETIAQAKQEVQSVAVEGQIFNYIISMIETTRRASAIQIGASPRAGISLLQAAKAYAAISGRDYVTINDVQCMAIPVLRHRITLNPDVVKEGIHADRIIEKLF